MMLEVLFGNSKIGQQNEAFHQTNKNENYEGVTGDDVTSYYK